MFPNFVSIAQAICNLHNVIKERVRQPLWTSNPFGDLHNQGFSNNYISVWTCVADSCITRCRIGHIRRLIPVLHLAMFLRDYFNVFSMMLNVLVPAIPLYFDCFMEAGLSKFCEPRDCGLYLGDGVSSKCSFSFVRNV